MTGVFAQDVRPWEGGILTTVVNTFENMDGKGHGAKLECLSMMVSISNCSLCLPKRYGTAISLKKVMSSYHFANSLLAYTCSPAMHCNSRIGPQPSRSTPLNTAT